MDTLNNNPNYELLKKWWATRAPYAPTLQTVRQTRSWHGGTCAYLFARFVFSETFKPTRSIPVNLTWCQPYFIESACTVTGRTAKNKKKNYFWLSIVVLESFDCTWWDLSKNVIAHYFVSMLTTFYRLSHIMQNSIVFVLIYLHMYRYTHTYMYSTWYTCTLDRKVLVCVGITRLLLKITSVPVIRESDHPLENTCKVIW